MNAKEYIASGILELYVTGQLSEDENEEVFKAMKEHPEVLQEVLHIEAALIKLGAAVSPHSVKFHKLKDRLSLAPVVHLNTRTTNWISYTGWAASILLAGGLIWTLNTKKQLENDINTLASDKLNLEIQIEDARYNLSKTKELLSVVRDRNILSVPLGGQGEFASSYATVYWNKEDNTIYLDGQGLPNAPDGKVWQVWSLKLNPLTPTSLGTIDDFNEDDNKIFKIANNNDSDAFGITLEPEGGSPTPTMEQLHTLGVVQTLP